MSIGTTTRLARAIVAAGTALLMHPSPAATITPTTPVQTPPGQKAKIPPPVTYLAVYKTPNRATLPPRLGGWACSGPRSCTLRTTRPATRLALLELCRGLVDLAREQRITLSILEFRRAEGTPNLGREDIIACNRPT